MNKALNVVSLSLLLAVTGCDWFGGKDSSNKTNDVYTAEFELSEAIPTLVACDGTTNVQYKVKECFKNGVSTELSNCSGLFKEPLEVKSPAGTLVVNIEGENEEVVGEKTYQCDQGESLSEEKVTVDCSDSRYAPYSLGDSSIDNTCKPYAVEVHDGMFRKNGFYIYLTVVTDSIGDVYEMVADYTGEGSITEINQVDFPKVKNATVGSGGICGFNNDKVWCQQRASGGVNVLSNIEISDLSRNVNILKIVHDENLLCALYEDNQVACTQAPRYAGSPGTNRLNGAAGRGIESNEGVGGTNETLVFENSPLIPEYEGAIDISAARYLSCALFPDQSVKCSGLLGYLSIQEQVNVPIYVENKIRSTSSRASELSFCPFPLVSDNNCYPGYTNIDNKRILYSIGGFKISAAINEEMYIYNNSETSNPIGFTKLHDMKIDKVNSLGTIIIVDKKSI